MYLVVQKKDSAMRWHTEMAQRKSFTLIELLITVAIIAIMAAIAIPNLLEAQIRSKIASVVTNQSMIAAALDSYYVDYEQYPFNNLLIEAVVPAAEVSPPAPQAPMGDFFPGAPFVLGEEPPEAFFFAAGETTGALTPPRMHLEQPTYWPDIQRSAEATTRTVVREIPYSSEIPITTHLWQLCRSCSTVNARTDKTCTECGRWLTPVELYAIYNQSLNGDVLSVLTTPVAYLPNEVNNDIFAGRRLPRQQAFRYANYLQTNPEGIEIPLLGRHVHYALISYGPDLQIDYVHCSPEPHITLYDPTNGTVSRGDIVNFGH